jgi:hypothetical protein
MMTGKRLTAISRSKELSAKANEERCRCRDWLLKIDAGEPAKVFDKRSYVAPQYANSRYHPLKLAASAPRGATRQASRFGIVS